MEDMIAYCGIDCSACPAYRATRADDDAKRTKVADFWSKMFGTKIEPSDINCDGCRQSEGRLFGHCKSCTVRLCAMEKGISSCGLCSDYSCETLDNLLAVIPREEPRKNLEAIKKTA